MYRAAPARRGPGHDHHVGCDVHHHVQHDHAEHHDHVGADHDDHHRATPALDQGFTVTVAGAFGTAVFDRTNSQVVVSQSNQVGHQELKVAVQDPTGLPEMFLSSPHARSRTRTWRGRYA